jgi:hypothetical protein
MGKLSLAAATLGATVVLAVCGEGLDERTFEVSDEAVQPVRSPPARLSETEHEDAFVAAAETVIDFLRGDTGFNALSLSDTVTFHLAPEGGGGVAKAPAADLRDRTAWRVPGPRGHSYNLVPPAGLSRLTTRFRRHVRCFEYDLEDEFPELAPMPHVGARLEPADRTSCLQTWNLTLVFEAGTMPPRLSAVVYDQWEW